MMKTALPLVLALTIAEALAGDDELRVNIAPGLAGVDVVHDGKPVTIMREQSPDSTVRAAYARTSRDCPPFCVQPIVLAPGVETIGELEMLMYLERVSGGDPDVIVIDSRTEDWVERGTIPGSVNIPWTRLNPAAGADPFEIADILENRFGALAQEGLWNFTGAKTLVLFCNGMWCGQSPANIRTLLGFGYPPHKLKWYRGGMQDWAILGLTIVR